MSNPEAEADDLLAEAVRKDRTRYRIRTIAGGVFWVTESQMKAWVDIWLNDPSAPEAFAILRVEEDELGRR